MTPRPPVDALWEVVDGQYRELPPRGAYAGVLASRLLCELGGFLHTRDLGKALAHLLFAREPHSLRQYRPALAFVSRQRWPKGRPWPDTDPTPVVPEVVVEVLGPNDIAEDVTAKVKEYLDLGVLLVWVVYPQLGWLVAFEPQGRCRYLTAEDELDGGAVLPGFRLPLRELFTQSGANGPAVGPDAPA